MYNIPKNFVVKYNNFILFCLNRGEPTSTLELISSKINSNDLLEISWSKNEYNRIIIWIKNFKFNVNLYYENFSTIEILYLFSVAETLRYAKKSDVLNEYFIVDEDLVKELQNCSPNEEMEDCFYKGNILKLLSFSKRDISLQNISIYTLINEIVNKNLSIDIMFDKMHVAWTYSRYFFFLIIFKILFRKNIIKKSNALLEIE